MTNSVNHRIDWIEIAKGISIIIVVLVHSRFARLSFYGEWPSSWTIPFFFFISGFLFYGKSAQRFIKRKQHL